MKIKIFTLIVFIWASSMELKAQYSYLGSYTADGRPNYLVESDVVTSETLNLISNALPENYPVPLYNPQYISSGYDTDIRLVKDADVWVTFVDEGAGYKNVLGFYTYDLNNPKTSTPSDSEITIIFPNVSKLNSGGSLLAGNKVKLGSFKANTGIGFILIANGWKGSVTDGLWRLFSNPEFNPEAKSNLRNHNVLITDVNNQRIILGFEDIRRDYSNCDNDFNDALFYVTASPYSAIESNNLATIESANSSIQSANLGGLESNGRLASKIASRNFNRSKNPKLILDDKKLQVQKSLDNQINSFSINKVNGNGTLSTHPILSPFFPNTGMFGSEVPYTSTPTDLLKITNAKDFYSLDYYNCDERVSAGLATYTSSRIYDHSKSICDRLNGSSLEDVRTIVLGDHKLINIKFKKPNGEIEYGISFSVQLQNNAYHLFSYWNIDQYPAGEYINFQVWGKNMGQICTIVNNIFLKLHEEAPIVSNPNSTSVPLVYVKKGYYKNGKLNLIIVNKSIAKTLTINGNASNSETEDLQSYTENINWNNETEKTIELSNLPIFDIGLSIAYDGSPLKDALYLADGSWGVDYNAEEASNIKMNVEAISNLDNQNLNIERNPTVSGELKGTFNIFRNAKAGHSQLDITAYNNIAFTIKTNYPVEVVLVSDNLIDWNERAIYTVKPVNGIADLNIPINNFKTVDGKEVVLKTIRSLVFTIRGDYKTHQDFAITVSNVNFNNNDIKTMSLVNNDTKISLYPNPIENFATFNLPNDFTTGNLSIIDLSGQMVAQENMTSDNGKYVFERKSLNSGIYIYKITSTEAKTYSGKLITK